MRKLFTNSLLLILLIFSSFQTMSSLYVNQSKLTHKFDVNYWDNIYKYSQYNIGVNEFKGMIDDPELFSVAGWHYVHGMSPEQINFEHQPLAKYFFGAMLLVFPNAVPGQIILAFLIQLLILCFGKKLFRKSFWSAVPLFFLTNDRLFIEQMTKIQLDLMQVFWLLLYMYFFSKCVAKYNSKKFLFCMLFFGCVSLSKTFFIGGLLFVSSLIFLMIKNREMICLYVLGTVFSLGVYFLGYMVFFLENNLLDFIDLHIKIIRLVRSYVPEYHKFEIFRILLFGSWQKWFDDFKTMSVQVWSWQWPISFILSIGSIRFIRSMHPFILLNLIWVMIYMTTISRGLVFPRYLMAILPSMYLLATYFLFKLTKKFI